jgi:GntR family transcriptional regulator
MSPIGAASKVHAVSDQSQSGQAIGLDIAIDRRAEIPIGVQLAWGLRTRIGDGRLTPGERLPGLRELAAGSGVNVNTVRAVYQRLEQEGLIESHQGSGTFVAVHESSSAAASIAADAAREAQQSGVDPREVAAALYVAGAAGAGGGDAPGARRLILREQIASLERTLGEIEASHPEIVEMTVEAAENRGPLLLDVDALEAVRTSLVRRLATVQAAIDGVGGEPPAEPPTTTRKPEAARGRTKRARVGVRPAAEGM